MHDAEFTIHDYFGLGLIKKFKRPMGVNKRCNDFAAAAAKISFVLKKPMGAKIAKQSPRPLKASVAYRMTQLFPAPTAFKKSNASLRLNKKSIASSRLNKSKASPPAPIGRLKEKLLFFLMPRHRSWSNRLYKVKSVVLIFRIIREEQ